MAYQREVVIAHDDSPDEVIEKINKILLQNSEVFAMVEPEDDCDPNVTFRFISVGTADWGEDSLKGCVK